MQWKTWSIVTVIVVFIIGGFWLWAGYNSSRGAGGVTADTGATSDGEGGGGMAENCENDLTCGNRFLAACEPAVFSAQSGAFLIETTIIGERALAIGPMGCEINSSVTMSQLAGLADASFDKNADGRLNMYCTVQKGLNFNTLIAYLKGPGLQSCDGELKAFYDSLEG